MTRAIVTAFALHLLLGGAAPAASPPSSATDQLGHGKALYRHHCAACHGLDAEGAPNWDEPNADGELPAPPHTHEGHTWRHADSELHHMIAKGWRDPFNKTPRLTMPAFATVLSDADIAAVVAYLKTLWTDEQRAFQARRTAETK